MTRKAGRISTARRANSSPSMPSGPSGILMSVNSSVMGAPSSKTASASRAFPAENVEQPSSSMIDSARARMVGSSSATSTAGVGNFFLCVFGIDNLHTNQTKRPRGDSVTSGNPARPNSQHAATEKDMIQRQDDDRAD